MIPFFLEIFLLLLEIAEEAAQARAQGGRAADGTLECNYLIFPEKEQNKQRG